MDEGGHHVQHEYVPNLLGEGNKGHKTALLTKRQLLNEVKQRASLQKSASLTVLLTPLPVPIW